MARFLADENLPRPAVDALRDLGHDVLTVSDIGLAGRSAPDDEVLRHASSLSRVLVTHNRRHFIRLHQDHPDHAGIVVCTPDADAVGLASRISSAVAVSESMLGRLIRISRPKIG